jgi:hypothetical protein
LKFTFIKKSRKYLGRVGKRLISNLPENLKGPLIRNLIAIDRRTHANFIVKLAESTNEYEQVFKLITENYIDQGFMKSNETLKLNKYQIANSTAVIIAKVGEKVIGTLSLIKRVELGLPLERVFDISQSLEDNSTPTEITCLAIDRNFRRKDGFNCLFPLMKYMYLYCRDYMKVNKLFIACFPRDVDFYSAILFFKKIKGRSYVADYSGAPAECLVLNFEGLEEIFKDSYNHKKIQKNLYRYFVCEPEMEFELPNAIDSSAKHSNFNYDFYQYFKNKNYELTLLSPKERAFFNSQFNCTLF